MKGTGGELKSPPPQVHPRTHTRPHTSTHRRSLLALPPFYAASRKSYLEGCGEGKGREGSQANDAQGDEGVGPPVLSVGKPPPRRRPDVRRVVGPSSPAHGDVLWVRGVGGGGRVRVGARVVMCVKIIQHYVREGCLSPTNSPPAIHQPPHAPHHGRTGAKVKGPGAKTGGMVDSKRGEGQEDKAKPLV